MPPHTQSLAVRAHAPRLAGAIEGASRRKKCYDDRAATRLLDPHAICKLLSWSSYLQH